MSIIQPKYDPALHTGGKGLQKKQADYHYSYLVAAMAALGGLLFGYDTGVISGAELFLVKAFHLTPSSEEFAVSAVLVGTVLGGAGRGLAGAADGTAGHGRHLRGGGAADGAGAEPGRVRRLPNPGRCCGRG